ncbi:hypothetical protein [Kitasatospora sp. NPDC051705]
MSRAIAIAAVDRFLCHAVIVSAGGGVRFAGAADGQGVVFLAM